MASVKYGDIIVDMRGKVAGHVYARNKGGAYSRTWVKPTNPKSTAQLAVRSVLSTLAQAWRGLTQDQRDAWTAATANFKIKNRLGEILTQTGNGLYVQLNKNLAAIGVATINTPPAPAAVGSATGFTATADVSDDELELTFTGVGITDTAFKIFATPALSPGKNSAGSEYRQIGYTGTAPTSPFDASAMYNAVFGSVGPAGSKIFVKIEPVHATAGIAGQAVEAVAVITA